MLNGKGFTLIEALIAVLLAFIIAIGVASLIGFFQSHLIDRTKMSCLIEGANSGLEACRAGQVISSITCGSLTVGITIQGSCSPPSNTCNDITATASLNGNTFSLTDAVCNFD